MSGRHHLRHRVLAHVQINRVSPPPEHTQYQRCRLSQLIPRVLCSSTARSSSTRQCTVQRAVVAQYVSVQRREVRQYGVGRYHNCTWRIKREFQLWLLPAFFFCSASRFCLYPPFPSPPPSFSSSPFIRIFAGITFSSRPCPYPISVPREHTLSG
eukprot:2698582-Rhodomonas_salina.1